MPTCATCDREMSTLRIDPSIAGGYVWVANLYLYAKGHGFVPRFTAPNVALCHGCLRAEPVGDVVPQVEPDAAGLIAGELLSAWSRT